MLLHDFGGCSQLDDSIPTHDHMSFYGASRKRRLLTTVAHGKAHGKERVHVFWGFQYAILLAFVSFSPLLPLETFTLQ